MNHTKDEAKQRRRRSMLAALSQQLENPQTPEVKHHYDRLCDLGHSDAEARELMAAVLAVFFWHTLRKDDYSYDNYLQELSKLPDIAWINDEQTIANTNA